MRTTKSAVAAATVLVAALACAAPAPAQQAIQADLPPNAKAGECYARIAVPAQFRTVSETVLKKAASEKIEVVPPRYVQVDEQVMVKPATVRIEPVPAVFETVEEQIMVKPETRRLETVPAVLEKIEERVLVKPATMVWKKGRGPIQRVDDATGEIMCLVEEPAVYKDVTRTVVKTPATTREVVVPAEYQVVRKQVLKTPATTREVPVPAEFKTVKVTRLAEPAREVRTPIAAEYQTVEKTEKVAEGRVEWRSILCDTNMTVDKIKQIQRALAGAGFSPGPIDGVISVQTMNAVNAYQRAKSLPVDRFLNLDTVRHLGVSPT